MMQHDQPEPAAPDKAELLRQHRESRQQAVRFIIAQLISTLVLALLWLSGDSTQAISALAGGAIASTANAWFVLRVFRQKLLLQAVEMPESLLANFYAGEIYRFVFTGAMFIIAFVLIEPVSVVALLTSFLLVHLTPALLHAFGGGA